MASSTAIHEPTHRSPSLTAWHPTLLSRPRHHRHHHHAQQHRTSLMRTAAATAAAAVCYPEMSPGKAIHIAGLTGGSEGPHQPNMVAVTARPCCCWSGCWSWVHHSIYWRSVPARSGSCNVFKGLFHSAIPLLKDPVLRASVHLTGDVLRGKTMKQALKTASPSW